MNPSENNVETQPTPEVKKPSHSVRVVVFDSTDHEKFFLLTETDDEDNWKLPGGRLETIDDELETPDVAANRETLEELGITGEEIGLKPAAELHNDDGISARYIYYGYATPEQLEDKGGDDIARTAWVTEHTIPLTKNLNHILAAVAAAKGAAEAEHKTILGVDIEDIDIKNIKLPL